MKAFVHAVPSSHPDASSKPIVCFLPGGPGLSSTTLRSMEVLSRSFDLGFVDPPGTGEAGKTENPTFDGIIAAIESALIGLGRKLILCGHSFGGIYAAEIALRGKVPLAGLVFIAAPLSISALRSKEVQYAKQKGKDSRLAAAAKAWIDHPSEETFREWLTAFGPLYFVEANIKKGEALIAKDRSSMETFRAVRNSWKASNDTLDRIKRLSFPKIFIGGKNDRYLSTERLRLKAEATGSRLTDISGAGHFVTFDQPEAVARVIEDAFASSSTEKTPQRR